MAGFRLARWRGSQEAFEIVSEFEMKVEELAEEAVGEHRPAHSFC